MIIAERVWQTPVYLKESIQEEHIRPPKDDWYGGFYDEDVWKSPHDYISYFKYSVHSPQFVEGSWQ